MFLLFKKNLCLSRAPILILNEENYTEDLTHLQRHTQFIRSVYDKSEHQLQNFIHVLSTEYYTDIGFRWIETVYYTSLQEIKKKGEFYARINFTEGKCCINTQFLYKEHMSSIIGGFDE